MADEHAIVWRDCMVGLLGPRATAFTFAWLASHRGRLRSVVIGGRRLTLIVSFDREGNREVGRTPGDLDAIYQLVHGEPPPEPFTEDEP